MIQWVENILIDERFGTIFSSSVMNLDDSDGDSVSRDDRSRETVENAMVNLKEHKRLKDKWKRIVRYEAISEGDTFNRSWSVLEKNKEDEIQVGSGHLLLPENLSYSVATIHHNGGVEKAEIICYRGYQSWSLGSFDKVCRVTLLL